jgi:hypothetical protein
MADTLLDLYKLRLTENPYSAEFIKTAAEDLPTECKLPDLTGTFPTLTIDPTLPPPAPHVDVQVPVIPIIVPPVPCIPTLTANVRINECPNSSITVTGTQLEIRQGTEGCDLELFGELELCGGEACKCVVTAELMLSGVYIPDTNEGREWIQAKARSTTITITGKSLPVSASGPFNTDCPGCIFSHHKAELTIPCDPEGYIGEITPATNWAEGAAIWAEDPSGGLPTPTTNFYDIGNYLEAPPCVDGVTSMEAQFQIAPKMNLWYVVTNGKLMMSYNADSPPFDPNGSSGVSC